IIRKTKKKEYNSRRSTYHAEYTIGSEFIHYLYMVLRYELLTGIEFKKLKDENYFRDIEGYNGSKVKYLETITDYFENMSID
ncbi:hypothetical protein, partial [Proteus mirabilis]|uniref:hypothetical protein n=1 Tax=Proteus mirabilis TaxID=584 RepID=UPI001A93056C